MLKSVKRRKWAPNKDAREPTFWYFLLEFHLRDDWDFCPAEAISDCRGSSPWVAFFLMEKMYLFCWPKATSSIICHWESPTSMWSLKEIHFLLQKWERRSTASVSSSNGHQLKHMTYNLCIDSTSVTSGQTLTAEVCDQSVPGQRWKFSLNSL